MECKKRDEKCKKQDVRDDQHPVCLYFYCLLEFGLTQDLIQLSIRLSISIKFFSFNTQLITNSSL